MSSVSNVTNAGTSAEEIQISLTDVNSVRGTHAFGMETIEPTVQEKTEGIVSGMLSSTETGFYTARSEIKTLDLICEGEILGLVSGEWLVTGNVGDVGYDTFLGTDPVQPVHPESWLKSIYLNETPVVGDGNLYNYQMVAVAHTNGEPGGIKDTDAFLGINDTEGIERARVINERLRGPDPTEEGEDPEDNDNPFIYHPKVYYLANPQISKVKVNIKIPTLKFVKMGSEYEVDELGDAVGTKLTFKFRYRAKYNNGTTSVWLPTTSGITESVEGLMSSAYVHPVTIPLPAEYMTDKLLGWEIEVTRITLDSIEGNISNQAYVDSVVEVFSSMFSFPNAAVIAMEFDAEYFSQIPTRAFDVRLKKVKVPIGYDPIMKTYPGNWQGDWQGEKVGTEKQWTDNPAWIFYDLLTNKRYGLGKYVDDLTIDKWTLYEIARYCDELVDDGNNGVEPRFSANVYINTREQAEKVLKDFASIFRSMVYFGLGNVHAVQDAPRVPIAQFVNANVELGNFTYSSSSRKSRATVVSVRYNDKTNYYKPSLEFVEDAQAIKKYGFLEKEITAFGCTSKAQAIRLARWVLYTESYETEMVNFTCGLEAMVLRPGDLIKVVDENRAEEKSGGRIVDVTESGFLLDKHVPIGTNNKKYLFTLTTPTYFYDTSITNVIAQSQIDDIRRAHIQTTDFNPSTDDIRVTHFPYVSGVSGEANQIMGTEIEFHPDSYPFDDIHYNLRSGDLSWSVQDMDYGENYYSIISIKESNNFKHRIEALEHVQEKYLAVESGITFTPPDPFNPISTSPPPNPSDLKLTLEVAKDSAGNNTHTQLIKYEVTKPDPAGTTSSYLIFVKEGSDWEDDDLVKKADGTSTSIPKEEYLQGNLSVTVNPGQKLSSYYFPQHNNEKYYFRVFAQNSIGIMSAGYEPASADHWILVQSHYPIRDVKVHSLRLAGDSSANPPGHKSVFTLARGKDFIFTWDISFANSYITGYPLEFQIYITKPCGVGCHVPVINSSTSIKSEVTPNQSYIFTFEDNIDAPLYGSPFRKFDFIVEAKEIDSTNTSSYGFTNSNGYDIYLLDNPRVQDCNLTPRSLDRTRPGPIAAGELMTTEQFVTSDGKLELKIRQSYFNDLAGGIMYLSAQPFDYTDFDQYGRPDNAKRIAELNVEELERSGQYQILSCPWDYPSEETSAGTAITIPGNIPEASFEFNYTQTYYMAAKIMDSFDKARRDAGSIIHWDEDVPILFSRYNTGSNGQENINGGPCALCSGYNAVEVYPYQYSSANSDNPFFSWVRINVNGQWEGNGVAAVKMLTKGDVYNHYGYRGYFDYSCDMVSILSPGMGYKPNHEDAITMCRFSQGKLINYGTANAYLDQSTVGSPAVVFNQSSNNHVTGLLVGVPTASLWPDESIPSLNALGEVIDGKSRPLKGFRRFRIYFDQKRLPPPFEENSLASYSVVGMNSWNGKYESFNPNDPDNILLGSETVSASTFGPVVTSWLDAGEPFENLPGIWNHHPAGFGAGFGGLKKSTYYFDVHLGRMIDGSYLNEAFFGVLSSNDYSMLAQMAEARSTAVNDLTIAQFDPNTFVTETL